ncbi:MAG: peptide-methionine (R)-S-oxide reductase MsrB [Gammaproteobacteria bacterium]|nr:peptide-methionine (R)-S-oxide reductase MsrB [Gammaproteobacteria bacterium]
MNRRTLLGALVALPAIHWLAAGARAQVSTAKQATFTVLDKAKSEWKKILEPARYAILFKEDTERPGTSALNQEKRDGTFICAACYLPLFESEHKYESGTGWPSFTQPIDGSMETKRDFKLVFPRTEYHCARCGGHQGHVFNDGPRPRGERWCNNGLALLFVADEEELPTLRA